MILVALILNVAGFLSLAATDERYRVALPGRDRRFRRPGWIKTVGTILIAVSGCSLSWRAGFGSAIMTFGGISTVGAALALFCVTAGRHLRAGS